MKMNKMKLASALGAIGLSLGVLGACAQEEEVVDMSEQKTVPDKDYKKVVNSEGETVYVEEDEYEDNHAMFIPFSAWNGSNHANLTSSSGFKGSVSKTMPTKTVTVKSSGSGIGKSSGKSGGFGG